MASPQHLYVAGFPRFDGSGLRKWLGECEEFFYLNNIPLECQVKMASNYLVGIARQWYDNYMRTRYGLAPFWSEFIVDISSGLAEFDHHPTVGHDFYAKSGYLASQVSYVRENYYFAVKGSAEIVADNVFEEMLHRIKCPEPDSFGHNLEGRGAAEHNEVLLVLDGTMSDVGNDLNIVVDNVFDEMPQTDTLPENVRFAEEDVVNIPKLFDKMLVKPGLIDFTNDIDAFAKEEVYGHGDGNINLDVLYSGDIDLNGNEEPESDDHLLVGKETLEPVVYSVFDPGKILGMWEVFERDILFHVLLTNPLFPTMNTDFVNTLGELAIFKVDDSSNWAIFNFALDPGGYSIDAHAEDVLFLFDPGGQLRFGLTQLWM